MTYHCLRCQHRASNSWKEILRKRSVSHRLSAMSDKDSILTTNTVSFNCLTLFNMNIELVIPTRFSSKPPPPNTFLNFQPTGPGSASYMSEKARVTSLTGNRFLNTNVEFQKEDKNKKLNLQQARAENKRANVEQLNHKIF